MNIRLGLLHRFILDLGDGLAEYAYVKCAYLQKDALNHRVLEPFSAL